jgi:hypothetical protein
MKKDARGLRETRRDNRLIHAWRAVYFSFEFEETRSAALEWIPAGPRDLGDLGEPGLPGSTGFIGERWASPMALIGAVGNA